MYYTIDPTNPSLGLNPRVRSSQGGRTFTGNVDIAASTLADESLKQQLKKLIAEGKVQLGKAGELVSTGAEAATAAIGKIPKGKLLGGSALLASVPSLMEGDVVGGAARAGGTFLGGTLAAPLGPLGIAGGSYLGSLVAGGIADTTKAALEKTPQAVSIPTPFGDLPLNASAQQLKYLQQLGELGESQQRNALQTRVGATIDLTKKLNDEDLRARQAGFSILQAEQNADLTRAQALINSQNNAYMQQMVLGGAVNQTIEAQRERGAFMRQAIASNPYVTALAAPNVSIG